MRQQAKELITGIMKRYADAGVKLACEAITEAIAAFTKNITAVWQHTKENIQTMPEDQYKEFLEELTPEQRGWAAAIRMVAKKEEQAAAGQESGKEI